MTEKKCFSKNTAAVFDIDYDLECGPHTRELIAGKMQTLAELGFKRVQLIIPPPGYPNYNSSSVSLDNSPDAHFHLQSVLNVGDPVFHYIKEAHKSGMEVIAVIKPYEGGGSYTLPHGGKPLIPRSCLEQLGGTAFGFDSFIARHPEMRVERKNIENYDELISKPVSKIELAFCIEKISQKFSHNEYMTLGDAPDVAEPLENVQLWLSRDNGTYELHPGALDVKQSVKKRIIKDINGNPLYREPKACRIVEISGITAQAGYFAVMFSNPGKRHVTIPYSMISLSAADGVEIPSTVTSHARTAPVVTDNLSLSGGNGDFSSSGFEFQAHGSIFYGNGWEMGSVYGIAKGKLRYMKGCHCEAYPEVRTYWLEQIKDLLALGADGIGIRLQCHSSGVVDFMNYGFNRPLTEKFRERYGRLPQNTPDDYLKIMRIRGEFFELFLEDAASLLESTNKIFQVHLRNCYEYPTSDYNFNDACFWAMPKLLLDWKKVVDIADEITLKDYNWGCYDPENAQEIKNYAKANNKPLWVMCYLQQGGDLNPAFCAAVEKDERIHGMQLYEVVCNRMPHASSQAAKGIIGIDPDGEMFVNENTVSELKKLIGKPEMK